MRTEKRRHCAPFVNEARTGTALTYVEHNGCVCILPHISSAGNLSALQCLLYECCCREQFEDSKSKVFH